MKHESGELLGNYAGKTHTTLFISPRVHRVFCLAVLEFQPREKRCHFLRNIRNNELLAAAVASVLHDAPHERSRSIVLRRSLTYLDDTMSQHEGSVSAHRARSTAAPGPTNRECSFSVGSAPQNKPTRLSLTSFPLSDVQMPSDVFFLIYGATMVFFMQTGFALLEVGSGESPPRCSTAVLHRLTDKTCTDVLFFFHLRNLPLTVRPPPSSARSLDPQHQKHPLQEPSRRVL